MHSIDKNGITVRSVKNSDLESVLEFGRSDEAFSVSQDIRFYEGHEVSEFIDHPDWAVGIAEIDDEIVGFVSVHRMSGHWAMLDNFYVVPAERGKGVSKLMYAWFMNVIKTWNTNYVTTLVNLDDDKTIKLLKNHSWSPQKQYQLLDLSIEGI